MGLVLAANTKHTMCSRQMHPLDAHGIYMPDTTLGSLAPGLPHLSPRVS
jgi:hypothetical protein